MVLVAGACTSAKPKAVASTEPGILRADVARAVANPAAAGPLVAGLNAFAADIYRNASVSGHNLVLSPLSIALALSMARAGAGGVTAAEIDKALHFPASGRDAGFNALMQGLKTSDNPPPTPVPGATRDPSKPPADPIVSIANALFASQGLAVGPPYLKTLQSQYGAGVRTVDFGLSNATDVINGWVRKQTAERIKKLFDGLDPATKLVLANAVYLKADWASPFTVEATKKESFTLADGSKTSVPMMHNRPTELRYAQSPLWQAVEIPYSGDRLAMWVVLPSQRASVESVMTAATLTAIGKTLTPDLVNLAMPKWDFATDLDLGQSLQKLGVKVAFGSGAEFSGISPDIFISQAVHRANITVDEYGTEAAAVTGLAFATSGTTRQPKAVTLDHPFGFVIVDKTNNAPIFIGSVADPAAAKG